jgi:hypothetical protein
LAAGSGVPHKQSHQANELRDKEDERENYKSKESMTKNFADNIAVQDAHDANS